MLQAAGSELLVPAGWARSRARGGIGSRARAAARPGPDRLPASQDPGQAAAELAGWRSACPNLSGEEISPGRMGQRTNPRESVAPNGLYEE